MDFNSDGSGLDLPRMVFCHESKVRPPGLSLSHPDACAKAVFVYLLNLEACTLQQDEKSFAQLSQRIREVDAAKVARKLLQSLAATIGILVTDGKDLGWDMDFLLSGILEVLPDAVRRCLSRLVQPAAHIADLGTPSEKTRTDDDLVGPPAKRTRLK